MTDTYVLEHIQRLRKQRGWSVYKLAKKSGIQYSSLNTMLKHGHIPTIGSLIKICNGFNVTLSQFFAYNNTANKTSEFIAIWNMLDETSQNYTLNYMKGLARLPMIVDENLQ